MAVYRLTSPEGEEYEVEAPDDATEEQVMEFFQKNRGASATEESAVVETIKNIPGSAYNLVAGIADAVTSPIQTTKGLYNAVKGGAQNYYASVPAWARGVDKRSVEEIEKSQDQEAKEVAGAVGKYYKDRFGGLKNIRDTIVKDPVGALADASLVTRLTSGALRAGGMSKTANALQSTSNAIDPLYAVGKTVTTVGKPVYTWGLGITSGSGAKAVEQSLKGSDEFTSAMRGQTTETEVLEKARGALDEIRNARSQEYQSKLATLKSANQTLDISDVKTLSDDWLKRYNVSKAESGDLDFSRSTVTGKGVDEVKAVYQMIQDWGSKADDLTPANLDILKRRIGSFYAQDRQSRAMVTSLEKAVKNKIVSAVPEYAEMTKGYAKASEVIKEMERALGLGTRVSADTALRKMITAIREDKTFRRNMLETLGKSGGEDLVGAASGLIMQPAWSNRLGSIATVGGTATVSGLTANPWLAPLLALASPRVVGEVSVLLGRLGKQGKKARVAGNVAYQAGRLPLSEEPSSNSK